jgi:hypothetical protein
LRRRRGLALDLQSVPTPRIYPIVDHPEGPAVLRGIRDVEGKELEERLGILVAMTGGVTRQSKLEVHQDLHGTFRIQGDLPVRKGCIPGEQKAEQDEHQHSGGQEDCLARGRWPEATRAEATDGLTRAALVGFAPHLLE